HNIELQKKFAAMMTEVRYEILYPEAELFLVAYGTTARIARTAIERMRAGGISAGLIRPISLFPFPDCAFDQMMDQAKFFLAVEMSAGQMVEDVRLAVRDRKPVHFYGRMGGAVPAPQEIIDEVERLLKGGN
ncbi:MAG: 3-methyl-2-oxobutanoate dehydrogenase subunit beta, partial [Symbiobacteriaceae bacterium]|nr:3-methyl-2-oxobutanoate dehydrogenase subunit beta [Symbiobacteriaceae bacterium]